MMPRECRKVGEALIKIHPARQVRHPRRCRPTARPGFRPSTIEGTPGVDSWVKANEPNRLVEFGPALYHVFIGFVQPFNNIAELQTLCEARPPVCVIAGDPPVETCTPVDCTPADVTGNVRWVHSTKAQFGITPGPLVDECWIGINALEVGTNAGFYAAPCNANSTFTIPQLPPGTYQLVVWDFPLDIIIYFASFTVQPGTPVDLSDTILVNAWFGNIEGTVFNDLDQDGFRDCVSDLCDGSDPGDEVGIESRTLNLRWRDGTIYQSTGSEPGGGYAFNEVFPLFRNYIIEVDFLNLKATGATIVVDDGGVIPAPDPLDPWAVPSFDKLNPQPQFCTQADIDEGICTTLGDPLINPNTGNHFSRTETGIVLLEATTIYADQTNIIDWGKAAYAPGENGGIAGVAVYATTRAEDDPALAATDPWEPGIPRVQFNLYADWNSDGVIDDANANGVIELADVDNHPFGDFPGPDDIDRNGNGVFNRGDALNIATSDSWDDNLPTGCQGPTQFVYGQPIRDCSETLQTWNTVRPGVFDGGWAFNVYYPFGKGLFKNPDAEIPLPGDKYYIVEMVPPPHYEVVKEEDKNVDFGDTYTPSPLLDPAPCVGTPANKQSSHVVPPFLTLFPDAQIPAFRAGETTPRCNMKQILLSDQQNAAADFHLFTEVPKAARGVGLINNDVAVQPSIPTTRLLGRKQALSGCPSRSRTSTATRW